MEANNAAAAKPYSACDGEIHAARDEPHCRDTQRQPARRQTDRRQDGGEGLDRTPTRRAREAGLLHYDLRTGSPEVANTVTMEQRMLNRRSVFMLIAVVLACS